MGTANGCRPALDSRAHSSRSSLPVSPFPVLCLRCVECSRQLHVARRRRYAPLWCSFVAPFPIPPARALPLFGFGVWRRRFGVWGSGFWCSGVLVFWVAGSKRGSSMRDWSSRAGSGSWQLVGGRWSLSWVAVGVSVSSLPLLLAYVALPKGPAHIVFVCTVSACSRVQQR